MNNDTQRILEMLSEDKITVEEAERLLEALGGHGPTYPQTPESTVTTEIPELEEENQSAREEGDREEPMGPQSGVRMGMGAYVSPDVELPPGTVVPTGAYVSEGVVVEGPIKLGVGAYIGERAHLMENCRIGQGANIGEGAKVGADAEVHMGAFIGERAKIGAGAAIGKGANIGEGTEISPGSKIPVGAFVPANTVW